MHSLKGVSQIIPQDQRRPAVPQSWYRAGSAGGEQFMSVVPFFLESLGLDFLCKHQTPSFRSHVCLSLSLAFLDLSLFLRFGYGG